MVATGVFCTGWEHGLASLSPNGGGLVASGVGTPSCSSSVKRSGSFSLEINPSASAEYIYITAPFTTPNVVVGRIYARYTSWNGTDNDIVFNAVTAGAALGLKIRSATHKVFARFWGAADGNECATVLALDTWYRIDYKLDTSTNPSKIDFQVDGTAATQSTYAQAGTTFTNPGVGATNSDTFTMHLDDWVISITSGDYPIGAGAVLGLRPNADGTHNNAANIMEDSAGNDIDGSTYYAYDKLDESPWTSGAASDYVRQTANGSGNYCEIQFADTTETVIQGVTALLEYASATATLNSGACIIRSNTTETTLWGNPTTRADYSESSAFYKKANVSPDGGAWSQSVVNAIRCRFGYSDDASPDPYWLAIMLEVAYGPSGNQFQQSIDGAMTPAGAMARLPQKVISGVITSSSILSRQITRAFTGGLTFVGILVKQVPKAFTGEITPAGTLARLPQKWLTGILASSGTLTRNIFRAFIGAISPAGGLIKQTYKAFTGAISPSGILNGLKIVLKALDGGLTFAGTVARQAQRSVSGAITPAGQLIRQIQRSVSGAISPSGLLASTKVVLRSLDGAFSSSGTLVKLPQKLISGTLSSTGALFRQAQRNLAGVLSSDGVLASARVVFKSLIGTLAPAGVLIKLPDKALAGVLTTSGDLVKQISRAIGGALSWLGNLLGNWLPAVPKRIVRIEFSLTQRTETFVLAQWTETFTMTKRSIEFELAE